MRSFLHCLIILVGLGAAHAMAAPEPPAEVRAAGDVVFTHGFEKAPNILFVIMDDVGIDQMASFGYGGVNPPPMPSIDAIANGGLRFRNTWSMPECSPGRAVAFTGRYPLRHNVFQAIGENDLANSHVSPYEVTVPKLLRPAGYESAMFGKFHLGGPENNPYENGLPAALGFDWFEGWIGGLPESIDRTAGGVVDFGDGNGPYGCGFVPDTAHDVVYGADTGACYTQDGSGGFGCAVITGTSAFGDSPGLQCLTRGGILVPNETCQVSPPANLAWNRENAHYVSPMTRNHDGVIDEPDLLDPAGRGYRATIEVDTAIEWINARANADHPWMATVSFSNGHTPMQHPPGALLPSGAWATRGNSCETDDTLGQRRLFDAMVEAMDTEFGRLLVETGLATTNPGGGVVYDPAASNTLIVIVGDNGSFAPTVKFPFDLGRSKGSAYQTGVWVPLIVAGAQVADPDRPVEHMVNVADLFRLFGEAASIDVDGAVPRVLDGASMLPYLRNSNQASLRDVNFTEGGLNLQANGARNGPCVIGGQCTHTPMSKSICIDNGGAWWGVGADVGGEVLVGDLEHCWQVNQAIYHDDPVNYETNKKAMGATTYRAVRNDHFKLVRNEWMEYDIASDDGVEKDSEELYHVNQLLPPLLKLDEEGTDVLATGSLTPLEAINYVRLMDSFDSILASRTSCPGDGNDDGRIDQQDVDNYHATVAGGYSGSSWYDVNLDGVTDADDLAIIEGSLGTTCWIVSP
ncbi:sulfatase-like hydrolase/transferase [Dokdonella sp.]|uniref:sulfatase-like hydrolase/transferase n=1 Tax=Dokdonella sp. TaxID=2291710 RepID=UPI0031BEDE41|nr:sulfatase-like hydrolase/transferase [Dokdonella sp.]